MFDIIFITLALLFIKHWYIDFVFQTDEELKNKGTYGAWAGIKHSLKHGLATLIIFLVLDVSLLLAIAIAVLDAVIHYHVDWIKMNHGNKDMTDPKFWNHLGLDQLAHYLTYLLLVWMIL